MKNAGFELKFVCLVFCKSAADAAAFSLVMRGYVSVRKEGGY